MITQAQRDYFNRSQWGSYENYVAGQRARYVNAANSTPSNFVLMEKIEADAKRLFYTLPTVTTNGGSAGIGSGSSGNIVQLPNPANGSTAGGGSGAIVNPDAAGSAGASIGEGIGNVLSKISLNNFLVIIGVVFGFVILKKAFKAVR